MATKSVPAKNGARVVRTVTPTVTKSAVLAHLATARTANRAKGVKAFYTGTQADSLASAVARAHKFPTLTEAGLVVKGASVPKTAQDGADRRAFARANRASLVKVSDILGESKGGEITHDRPENTVRVRLAGIAKALGLPADTYYAVRAEAYAEGETPRVYILRKWERGSRKAPPPSRERERGAERLPVSHSPIMQRTGSEKIGTHTDCSQTEHLFARRAGGASHFDPVLV